MDELLNPETAVGPAATAPIRQHGEEGFFVDGVMTLAQTLRAALVSRAEAVVRLAAQTNESVPAPFHLEQIGRLLVERLARETTRPSGRPRASSQSGLGVLVLVLVAAFGRQPFASVAEVMLAMFGIMASPASAMYAESVSISQYWNSGRSTYTCR